MARIKITAGVLDVEFEGEPEFIETKLLKVVEQMLDLVGPIPFAAPVASSHVAAKPASQLLELSTNTIAQMIGVKTGSDLALAAVAKINLIKGKQTAGRQEILDEMKEASTYYKESYASNLSSYLSTLVKSKRINLVSKGTYALAAVERSRLEDNLGAAP